MARISAGSTLVNQFSPPFVVSGFTATGWELRWNEALQAFESFDPSGNVVESGLETVEVALFPNVTQQVFVVPWLPDSTATLNEQEASFIITIAGVKQHIDEFSIITDVPSNTTAITLTNPVSSDTVEIVGLQAFGAGASITIFTAPGDGATTIFPLSWLAASDQSLIITLDGIKQDISELVISATEKIIAEKLSESKDKEIIEKTIKEL